MGSGPARAPVGGQGDDDFGLEAGFGVAAEVGAERLGLRPPAARRAADHVWANPSREAAKARADAIGRDLLIRIVPREVFV